VEDAVGDVGSLELFLLLELVLLLSAFDVSREKEQEHE
jgi:hypothetical protein